MIGNLLVTSYSLRIFIKFRMKVCSIFETSIRRSANIRVSRPDSLLSDLTQLHLPGHTSLLHVRNFRMPFLNRGIPADIFGQFPSLCRQPV